jgi:hypothetical protein
MEGLYRVEVKGGQAPATACLAGQAAAMRFAAAAPSPRWHSGPASAGVIRDPRRASFPDYDRHGSGNGAVFTGPGGRNSAVLAQLT